jgi:hypothetical protein
MSEGIMKLEWSCAIHANSAMFGIVNNKLRQNTQNINDLIIHVFTGNDLKHEGRDLSSKRRNPSK